LLYRGALIEWFRGPASPETSARATPKPAAADGSEIDHYTCPMHPSVHKDAPGHCPICGMTLVPVTRTELSQGTVIIAKERQQLIGVRSAKVIEAPMRRSLRAIGRLAAGAPRLRAGQDSITLVGAADRPATLRHALQRFAMREAHAALGPWLADLSAATGLRYERMQIRRQRTRWGSCSPSGTISLNACLIFQPAPVVNYLLVHELAHTRHMNHSRRFWRLVERFEPRWRELDAALTRGWREVPAWALA